MKQNLYKRSSWTESRGDLMLGVWTGRCPDRVVSVHVYHLRTVFSRQRNVQFR